MDAVGGDGGQSLLRYQQTSPSAAAMLALGESGRFEFKRDADAVTPKVLATLANAVALDPEREVAHLLVGVNEIEDRATGLVSGEPYGLAKGLEKSVARIQDVANHTRPIPVDIRIIEEAVAEAVPFLRIEVRPTMPPHYDDEGRRQTRQGRSTRALADDELLRIYLDREGGSFAARFRHAGEELRSAVGAVGDQMEEIADAIDQQIARPLSSLIETAESAASAAMAAESAAESVSLDVSNVEQLVGELGQLIEELRAESPASFAARVADWRRRVWWAFTVDTWKRSSARAERLTGALRGLLSRDISLDVSGNAWEVRVWDAVLHDRRQQRGGRGSLKWWQETLREVEVFMQNRVYRAPDLPDLRGELRADLDAATNDPKSLTRQFAALVDV